MLYPGGPEQADFILPFMVLETGLPALVVGLFCAGALSASMSTGDALLHAAASITVEDGIAPFTDLPEHTRWRIMQVLVVLVGAVAYVFALDEGQSLVGLLLGSYGIISQLAPPIVAALFWKRATTAGVTTGLIVGAAVAVFFFLSPELKPYDIHEGILGLLVHVPVLVAVSMATPPQGKERLDPFFEDSFDLSKPRIENHV